VFLKERKRGGKDNMSKRKKCYIFKGIIRGCERAGWRVRI
jgi:hypothetical protein